MTTATPTSDTAPSLRAKALGAIYHVGNGAFFAAGGVGGAALGVGVVAAVFAAAGIAGIAGVGGVVAAGVAVAERMKNYRDNISTNTQEICQRVGAGLAASFALACSGVLVVLVHQKMTAGEQARAEKAAQIAAAPVPARTCYEVTGGQGGDVRLAKIFTNADGSKELVLKAGKDIKQIPCPAAAP